jgi:phosphoheptose isomerase
LHTVARESGVIDLVTFTGRRSHSDLKLYYSAADAFVTMPWYEPFGMTPVEAMACGVPVIGARVGGIKYSIQENETGFLVEPDNPRQLADRIATLLSSQRLRQKMGRAGLARVRRSFQWASISESVAKLYERVLDDPEPAEIAEMERGFDSALEALRRSRVSLPRQTAAIAGTIAMAFERGRKLLICGNGGSAADAQHFAAEFTGRFCLKDRRPFPAIALTADSAFLTAWANDIGFEDVFSRQVEAFGQAGDVLVGISTSGRSPNVLRAFEMARRRGLTCIALGAGDGGAMADLADELLAVPETDTQRVQEVHLLLMHLICAAVEKRLAAAPPVDGPPTRIRLVRPAVIAERKPALVTA